MIKKFLLTCLRIAIGFILVSFLFMIAMRPGSVEPDTDTRQIFEWFYFGTMKAWLASVVLGIIPLVVVLKPPLRYALEWAPVYLPLVYGAASYFYLF